MPDLEAAVEEVDVGLHHIHARADRGQRLGRVRRAVGDHQRGGRAQVPIRSERADAGTEAMTSAHARPASATAPPAMTSAT